MFDLDKYINGNLEVKINGEVLNIRQPSARQTMEIAKLENEEKLENRCKITLLLLNNNTDNKVFTQEDVAKIPFSGQNALIMAVVRMKIEAESDPN